MRDIKCVVCGIEAAFPQLVKEPYTCISCQNKPKDTPSPFAGWNPYACPECGMEMSHSFGVGYVCDRCRRY